MSTYGQQLFKAFGQIKKSSMTRLHKAGVGKLKPHEYFMLVTIKHRYQELALQSDKLGTTSPPGVKISEISRCSSISMPGVSQTISSLVKQGYVKRITTDSDRRLVYVNLTPKGKALETQISESSFQLYDEAADILGPEDTQTLICLLEKLAVTFDTIEEKQNENPERKTP
ncbi:MarR family winged helix-turn-helix transcriptional regulator [Acetobacterium bakii]|uniref:MarR family winged helix-turn-helix transcriptional regulator n=1 Tax=Acetobacterium bakii TaxID=52689 RepID=UPI0006821B6D|nr:MarR family transcriptional regulator [Acetobacterium bakii]